MAPISPTGPALSQHFLGRQPSAIRIAGLRFAERKDDTTAINVAIGNVSLAMHPAMIERLRRVGDAGSPFADGVVRYTSTPGLDETRQAFLNVIAASGLPTDGLHVQVTDGGSQAMELVLVGCCGPAGTDERPLLLIDAAYTNYTAFAERVGRATCSITRSLDAEGQFSLPALDRIEEVLREKNPGALVVIPYDNPTGQLYDRETLVALAKLCVKHDLWMISDEAYREFYYTGSRAVSVWDIGEDEVPGITGRRISIETASKVWNACGLRIGGLVTDSEEFHQRAVAENTAGLCSNHIGQWIFGALAETDHAELNQWFDTQREYYKKMMQGFRSEMLSLLPGAIVSRADAALYSVIDVREISKTGFDALQFVLWCAEKGAVQTEAGSMTLLTAPMAGFYDVPKGKENPGRTQMRVAFVETPEKMALVPGLFAELFSEYEAQR